MDCTINVTVRGNHLTKDNRNAGVQYEANVRCLRIDFDEGWDGYAKTVTFWNALMGNPVKRDLTTDVLEDITQSTRIYKIPIPGEAMTEPGDMVFIIDGYVDGKRKRSLSDTLWVKEAPIEMDAEEPTDPTPTQAEQLQVQIDTILADIQDARSAAADAQQAASWAESSSQEAYQYAQDAHASFNSTTTNVILAQEAQDAAEAAKAWAETAQAAAEQDRIDAQSAQEAAASAAQQAASSEVNAKASETSAQASATSAYENAVIAKNARDAAAASETGAAASAASATASKNAAAKSETNAAASAAAAAKSAAEAQAVVGGDFATKTEAQGYADTAEGNANDYTDQQIAAIPTPDVSGQIEAHNTDTAAHADMRTELAAVARAKTGGEIDQRLQNRVEKTGDTMTGILTFDTPGLFSAFQKKRTIGEANYIMRAGIGNDGNGASVCIRLFSVASDGTETVVSHIEADSTGAYWVAPGGVRKTIAHSGNIGVLTAALE